MPKLELLKNYFSGFLALPPQEWVRLSTKLRLRRLKKGEFYFRQGDPVTELGFVLQGLLYNFYTNEMGEDFVKYFIREGNPVGCYSSLIRGSAAAFSGQALEPVTLVTIDYREVRKLYERHVAWEKMGRLIAERLYLEKEERERHFLMADAKARYDGFKKRHPDLHARVPQYLIASYIGITPVSLSRIRKG